MQGLHTRNLAFANLGQNRCRNIDGDLIVYAQHPASDHPASKRRLFALLDSRQSLRRFALIPDSHAYLNQSVLQNIARLC